MAHTTQNSPRPRFGEEVPLDWSQGMKTKKRMHGMSVAVLALALPLCALAQAKDDSAPPPATGTIQDGYVIQQSVEFGGRFASVDGNEQLYDTLVNLHTGPRLFGQELYMRPLTRGSGPFDSLYLSSFGFGGDPNDMVRLRAEKGKWYDFLGLYRRDQNYFDFNLFANPLNLNQGAGAALKTTTFDPTTMPWYANSPHFQDTTRNMGDFSLILFPQSKIRIRLGFARNDTQGTLDTTLESYRTIITEYDRWRSDRYQFGIDFRLAKRTTISFDQIFEHDRVDLNFMDGNLSFTDSATGTPVDIGILFPPSGCTPVANVTFPGNNVYVPSAGCNTGLFSFNRSGNVRTDIPTSRLSLVSNYFRKLDVVASGAYSSGQSDFNNYHEFTNGFGNSGHVPSLITGGTHTDRVSGNADLGLTYRFNETLTASDSFRWLDWRDPGNFDQANFTCTATPAPGLTAGTAGCTTAGATNLYLTYIAERTYFNTAKLTWTPVRRFSGYVGYRYGRRELTGDPSGESTILNSYYLITNGTPDAPENTTRINEHTALVGMVYHPTDAWRINADTELLSADNFFTNIAPRHQQRVRLNTVYKLNRWASLNGGAHFVETRNDFAENINGASTVLPPFSPATPNLFPPGVPPAYGHKDHWRYYTFGASLNPDKRVGFDFGWTYLDQLINSATCVPIQYNTIVQPVSAFCVNANNAPPATTPPAGTSTVDLPLNLNYQERTNSGYAILTFRPIPRVTLNFGYEITSTAGFNRWLLPGGSDSTGNVLVVSDIYGNSPPLAGNPIAPCPAASTAVAGGCAFPGPFPDAPLSQALNWHKPSAGVAVDVTKNFTVKAGYAYYDYNEKETSGLPLATLPRNFHAHMGTISLKYSF